ncbi:MAG TPA: class I SAM-dependent methyltransferase [Chitinophagaceae bacterium]
MYNSFQLAVKYLKYYLAASNGKGHGIHSPFVFNFVLDVLNNRQGYVPDTGIEALREKLLADHSMLQVEDYGAGSRTGKMKTRTVKDIARHALKPKKYSQLLYRLVRHYKPKTIIELGTSLGITTAYLASANPGSKVITIEGAPAIHGMAVNHFKSLGLENIEALQGNFDEVLPAVLNRKEPVDLVYIDGNHRKEPTLSYFNQLLPYMHNDSILVFDDIHWSKEMEGAWEIIKRHEKVRCSIDIFFLGFVFFRNEFPEKQHFTIRF